MKQVVVYRSPPTVHVYNVVEHGRRFFNKLIFTTNAAFCFGAFDGKSPFLVKQAAHNYVAAVGNPMEVASAGSSLVITRNLNASVGKQTFIPARFLQVIAARRCSLAPPLPPHRQALHIPPSHITGMYPFWVRDADQVHSRTLQGLLPACLLEEYMFWQSDDDTLTGYQPPSIRMDSTQVGSPRLPHWLTMHSLWHMNRRGPHSNLLLLHRPQTPSIVKVQLLRDGHADTSGRCHATARWICYTPDPLVTFRRALLECTVLCVLTPCVTVRAEPLSRGTGSQRQAEGRQTPTWWWTRQYRQRCFSTRWRSYPMSSWLDAVFLVLCIILPHSRACHVWLQAPYGSPLAKITELLMRLDNLSHVTVWSSSPSQPCTYARLPFPTAHLTTMRAIRSRCPCSSAASNFCTCVLRACGVSSNTFSVPIHLHWQAITPSLAPSSCRV